ncbi:glycosyltransferase family 4 protein [Acidobacteriota bacterium]
MAKSRVLFDATGMDTSHRLRGIGRYVSGLLSGFSSLLDNSETSEFELEVLRLSPQKKAHQVFGKATVMKRIKREAGFFYWIENLLRLKHDLNRLTKGLHIYHSTEPYSMAPWLTKNMATIATCHDLIPIILRGSYMGIKARIYFRWARKAYREVSGIVAISHAVKQSLMDHFSIPPEHIAVIYHGVESRFFENPGIKPPFAEHPYFLYAGGADKRKRLDLIMTAYARIQNDVPEHLVLCGSWPWTQKIRLLRMIKKLGIRDNVHILKHVTDKELIALYRSATAFVFPSLYEGFGLPVLEAQAAGCPVITSRLSALPEVAREAAVYLEGTDEEDNIVQLTAAMLKLSTDIQGREELRTKGLVNAASFTWKKTASDTLAVYQKVLQGDFPLDIQSER